MKYFKWMGVASWRAENTNHVFPENFFAKNAFTALCGFETRCMNQKMSNWGYCPVCQEVAPWAEKTEQKRRDRRAKRQELLRPKVIQKINDIIADMTMDDVRDVLDDLRKQKKHYAFQSETTSR